MSAIHNSKYIKLIKTFTKEESKSFGLWLNSPWSNSNKNLISLFEKIKKYYPDFNSPKLTKERLFKQILPNGKYSDRRMNNLLSEGYLVAEKFVIFQNLNRDQNLQKELLVKEFQNRHLEDWFFKESNSEIEKLESKEVKGWEDHLYLFQLHRQVYHHPNQSLRMKPANQTLEKMSEPIDLAYLLEKAAIINEKIFRNRLIKGENYDITLDLMNWLTLSKNVENLSIKLYKMRFDYTEENMLDQYFQLREFFLKRFKELNEREQKIHLGSLINDTIKLIRGRSFEITELLPLYKVGLEFDLLLKDGILTERRFVAVVAASNTKKDFIFSNELIEKYTNKLEPKIQKDGLFWAKAHTEYYKENLDKCLDILLNHNFKIQYFQQATRILTTEVYFDLYLINDSYHSYLFNYFDSFEKWILREKFKSKILKVSYLRFVQLTRILAKSISDKNYKIEKIENLLKNEPNIQASEWLNKKIKRVIKIKKRRPSNYSR
ncbi:MAG: hypothetical protein AB8H03_03315 [Saprospiraceae bacterium]